MSVCLGRPARVFCSQDCAPDPIYGSVAVSMLSVAYGRRMPANGAQIDNLEAFRRQIFAMCRSGCAQNPPPRCCPKPPSSRLSQTRTLTPDNEWNQQLGVPISVERTRRSTDSHQMPVPCWRTNGNDRAAGYGPTPRQGARCGRPGLAPAPGSLGPATRNPAPARRIRPDPAARRVTPA